MINYISWLDSGIGRFFLSFPYFLQIYSSSLSNYLLSSASVSLLKVKFVLNEFMT